MSEVDYQNLMIAYKSEDLAKIESILYDKFTYDDIVSAFMMACDGGYLKVIEYFIESEILPYDESVLTQAMQFASETGHFVIVKYLEDYHLKTIRSEYKCEES